nr:MAG TPA: hypothetical protein [Caudoviricetes sp.]
MQSASPNTLCFPTDSNAVVFNGKEYGGMTEKDRQDVRNSLSKKVSSVTIGYGLVDLDMAFASGDTPTSDEIYSLLGRDIEDRLMDINRGSYGLLEDYDSINHKLTVHFVDDPNAGIVDLFIDDGYLNPFYFRFDHNDGTVAVRHTVKIMGINNANYIKTNGIIKEVIGRTGTINVDVTAVWGHSWSETIKMIMREGCITVVDKDTGDDIQTTGTLQCSPGDNAIFVSFDELFRAGIPTRFMLVLTKGANDGIVCSDVFNSIYPIN